MTMPVWRTSLLESAEMFQRLGLMAAVVSQELPEDSPVLFELELVSFQRQQHWTSMGAADKIRRAQVQPPQDPCIKSTSLGECILRLGLACVP